jgi:hypothetical protein
MAWEAFRDYSLTGELFSGPELAILNRPFEAVTQDIAQLVAAGLSKGEAREFLEKLERIRGRHQERG